MSQPGVSPVHAVGPAKVPDAKTLGKLGVALGPEIVERIHRRVVAIAQEHRVVRGRRMRVDTTVVETDIHYPTDSALLGDGVRVLTRAMKRIQQLSAAAGATARDRTNSAGRCVLQIGRICRSRTEQGKDRLQQCYRSLPSITGRVVGPAKRFVREVVTGIKGSAELIAQLALEEHCVYLETMIPRVQQLMRQARERIFGGDTRSAGKLVSLFEPHTEIIRKGKAAKPTEFGKLIKFQEAEQQIVTH